MSIAGMPADIAQRIRERGPALDLELAQRLYLPLLARQERAGVATTRDVVYGPDERHRLDVYQPAIPTAPGHPVLVFFHGGGFVRGDKSHRDNIGYHFARHGCLVVIPNYRLAPAHRWPAGAEDVIRACQWARTHGAEYSGDPSLIFLAGESAGAAHVAAASLVRRFHPPEGLRAAGVLLISGVYNVQLERLARRQFGIATPDPRNEAYFGADPASYPGMSTLALIDAPPLPLWMSFAQLDLLQMQVQAGELFGRLVCDHGFSPDLRVIPSHNHLTQVHAVNTGDESLSGPMLEFMRAWSRRR